MRVLLLVAVCSLALAGAFAASVQNAEQSLTLEEEEMLVELLEAEVSSKSAKEIAMMILNNQGLSSRQASGSCSTTSTSATCCGHVTFAGKLDADACVFAEYNVADLSVHLKVTILGHDVIDETVSAENPPALCASIPDVPFMKICVKLSDLSINGDQFHGCVALSAKFFYKTVVTVSLGCFTI